MKDLFKIIVVLGIAVATGCARTQVSTHVRSEDRSDAEQAIAHTLDTLFKGKPVSINGAVEPFPETAFFQKEKHKVFFLNTTSVADSLFEIRGYRKAPDMKKTNLLKFYEGNVILIQFHQDEDGEMLFFWGAGPTFGRGYRIEIDESDPEHRIKYQALGIA